jgi:hypothetical protein
LRIARQFHYSFNRGRNRQYRASIFHNTQCKERRNRVLLTKATYPLNVALIRRDLTNTPAPNAGIARPRTTRSSGYATHRLTSTSTPLTLIYRLRDLYLEGFIPGNGTGQPYLFKESEYAINTPNRLAFGNDYRALGLSRSTAFRINIEEVNGAVIKVFHVSSLKEANGLKEYYWKLAIAFAEAVRFDDVLQCILDDKPIDDLDWTKHKRPEKVRVVKT